MRQTHISR